MKKSKKTAKPANLAEIDVLRRAKKPKAGDCFMRGKFKIVVLGVRKGAVRYRSSGWDTTFDHKIPLSEWKKLTEITANKPTLFIAA